MSLVGNMASRRVRVVRGTRDRQLFVELNAVPTNARFPVGHRLRAITRAHKCQVVPVLCTALLSMAVIPMLIPRPLVAAKGGPLGGGGIKK